MENFMSLVKRRQSVRKYSDQSVEQDKIKICLEVARLAPSASNSQPWTFIVVDQPELKTKIAEAAYSDSLRINKFAFQSPVMIVIVIEKPKLITQVGAWLKSREFPLIDIGIAAEHFCLQAAEIGLGTCMIGWFDEKKVKTTLNIPKNKRIGLLISLGYPHESYEVREKKRKEFTDICKFNNY